MSDELRDAFATILQEYPKDASNPSRAMSDHVRGAFDTIQERLETKLALRATNEYAVEDNADHLKAGNKSALIQFDPGRKARNERNPLLYVSIVFPPDMSGVVLALTDVRPSDSGPDDEEKTRQRENLRALLGQETDLAWEFESSTPRALAGDNADSGTRQLARGTLFHEFYRADDLPSDRELVKKLDALLRLEERYVEKFQSKDLLETEEVRDREVPTTRREAPEGSLEEESVVEQLEGEIPETRNLLLYGPPGTGKTYSTARRAVELCGELERGQEVERRELMRRYRRLRSQGRIEFVTFHQSFGYEEFVEGIRPVMAEDGGDSDKTGDDVQYEYDTGVFKRIALLAASEGLDLKRDDQQFEARWRALQQRVEEEREVTCKSKKAKYRVETVDRDRFRLVRIDGESSTTYTVEKKTVKRWWNNRHELGDNFHRLGRDRVDSVMSRPGNFTPNWVMYRLILEQGTTEPSSVAGVGRSVQRGSHDQRIADAATYLDERREERSTDAFTGFEGARQYVLIIDEINRGNISKILGELITLLEPDKRLTRDDELLVSLPYSKETFGVPPNLHLLGTMNTADRSIALLDAALRRRFEYEEMMPSAEVVTNVLLDGWEVETADELDDDRRYLLNLAPALMETINRRIEFLYDRDHQIGHSYFLEAEDLESLRQAFVDRIIPLLKEYFYGAWHQLGLVLGCPVDRRGNPQRERTDEHVFDESGDYRAPMVRVDTLDEQDVLRTDHPDFEDRQTSWEIQPEFKNPEESTELKPFFEGVLDPDVVEQVQNGTYVG